MKLRQTLAAAAFLLALKPADHLSACIAPYSLDASAATSVDTAIAESRATASGSLQDEVGATCYSYSLTLNLDLRQNGSTWGTTSDSGGGEVLTSIEGPASVGNCYSSEARATHGSMRATGSGNEACWQGPSLPDGDGGGGDENQPCEPACTPIIVDMDADGYDLTSLDDGVEFDIDADGMLDRVSWTMRGSDAFLWVDDNLNGMVDNGAELFGDALHANGFEKLAAYDAFDFGGNADGRIDSRDAVWQRLLLWQDRNQSGSSDPGETSPLSTSRFLEISLRYQIIGRGDEHGNWFRYQGRIYSAGNARNGELLYDVMFRVAR